MYFLSYQPLKDKLRSRTLSDFEALPYLLIFVGIGASYILFPNTEEYNNWDWISGVLSVALAVGGVYYAYTQNGGRQGFDVIQKYVVIGWIATFRCILAYIPVAVVSFWIANALGVSTEETDWFEVLLIAGFEALIYQRIGRHIADTK